MRAGATTYAAIRPRQSEQRDGFEPNYTGSTGPEAWILGSLAGTTSEQFSVKVAIRFEWRDRGVGTPFNI
jgi:hypothetical protein